MKRTHNDHFDRTRAGVLMSAHGTNVSLYFKKCGTHAASSIVHSKAAHML